MTRQEKKSKCRLVGGVTASAVLIGIESTVGGWEDMAPSACWVPAMGSGIIEVLKHEHTKIGYKACNS